MSVQEFRLPDPGEGLTEAEIVTWKVRVGDTVKINDIVVEIETAKSLVELPVPYAGVVSALLVHEGETVEVGTPIIAVSDGSDPLAAPPAEPSAAAPVGSAAPAPSSDGSGGGTIGETTSTGRTAVLVGYGVKQTEAVRRPRVGRPTRPAATVAPTPATVAPTPATVAPSPAPALTGPDGLPLAKPPVRKYAKDHGVDLHTVVGTGDGGVITRADVDAAVSGPATGALGIPAGASAVGQLEVRTPIKGLRKMMAQAMVASKFSAPHVTEWVSIDATATMDLVARLKSDREFDGVKVTPLLVLARAMCVAVARNPEVNSTWDEAAGEVVVKHYVNLGIAAATPRGLVVPNIKAAQAMSMRDLALAMSALIDTAREGRTAPADMAGGTITVTNVGVFGIDSGTPIINPGESAILAFGAVRRMPWVVTAPDGSESIEPRWVTQLALSFDHRHIDGALGSRFLADVAAILADPAKPLVWG